MTRRGTLAYYLAAWVIGCFVISAMAWAFAPPQEGIPLAAPARLLILYFLSLAYRAVDMLLFALLLRRAMRLWGTYSLWIWMLAGSVLGAAVVRLLLWSGDALVGVTPPSGRGPLSYLLLAVWTAPNALRLAGIWQAPVGGAFTAAFLCLVDRAFNRPAEEADAKAGVAAKSIFRCHSEARSDEESLISAIPAERFFSPLRMTTETLAAPAQRHRTRQRMHHRLPRAARR